MIVGLLVGLKEVGEYVWCVYGAILYFSKDSEGCSDENGALIMLMAFFLIIAALKIVLLVIVLGFMCCVFMSRHFKRRNERSASKDILRSLTKIKY